jgi:hypothetical protein
VGAAKSAIVSPPRKYAAGKPSRSRALLTLVEERGPGRRVSRPQPPKGGRCPYYEHISEGSISACGHRLSSPCSEPAAGGPTPNDCSSSAAHPGVAFACGQEMPFLSKCPGRSELCSRLACPCNELHCGQHNRYAIQGQLADQGSAVARAGRIRTTSRAG